MPIPIHRNPPPARSDGLLVDLADELGADNFDTAVDFAHWAREGVQNQPWSFGLSTAEAANCEAVYLKNADDGLPAWVTHLPFLLWRSLQCSSLSGYRQNLTDRVNYSLTTLISYSLALELESGAASGSVALKGNATYVPTLAATGAQTLRKGMYALETHLATKLHDAVGMIHLTAGLYTLAVADRLVGLDSRTPTGHLVVGDGGHTGQIAPQGQAVPAAGRAWIYATDNVGYLLSPVTPDFEGVDSETFNFARNTDRPLQERHGLLVFDPNVTGTVLVDAYA